MDIQSVYNYNHNYSKASFGKEGCAFINEAFRKAGVPPDLINKNASPVKRYPYHNKGGPAVVGEVYCNITREDGIKLEICMSEYGFYYRTNDRGLYGNNVYPCGFGTQPNKAYTTDDLSDVIYQFVSGRIKKT